MTEHLDVVIVGAGISGVSAAWHLQDRCPTKSYAILEERERHRRHLGPVPLPGHPLRLRHVHAGLPVPPVDRAPGHRRRQADPRLRQETPRRCTASTSTSGSTTRSSARTGRTPRTAGPCTSKRNGDAEHAHLLVPSLCSGYYNYEQGYAPDVRRRRGLHRPDHPSAVLARGPRLRRQEHRRDRQRRHRGHSGSGAGEVGRQARHDAAALTDLHPLAARAGQDRRAAQPLAARRSRPTPRSAGRTCCCRSALYQPARRWPQRMRSSARATPSASCPRATTSTSTSPRTTTRGTSGCAWCPMATCSAPSATARPTWSPTPSSASPPPASGSTRAANSTADIIITATGLNLQLFGGATLTVDGEPVDLTETMAYKGMMLSGLPNLPTPSATPTRPGR